MSTSKMVGIEGFIDLDERFCGDQELPGGSDDGDLCGFSGLSHGKIAAAGRRICSARYQGRHVKSGADTGTTAGDLRSSLEGATLIGVGRQARQAGDATTISH